MPGGKGIYYDENGNKLYEGDWKNGNPEGKRIKYYKNGNKEYEGDFKNGNAEGKGIKYYENGNKEYEGDFKNDHWPKEKGYNIMKMEIKNMKEILKMIIGKEKE